MVSCGDELGSTVYGSDDEMRHGLGRNKGAADGVIDLAVTSGPFNDKAFKVLLNGLVDSSAMSCTGARSLPVVSRSTREGISEKSESFLPVIVVSELFALTFVDTGSSSCAWRFVNAPSGSCFDLDRPMLRERKMG